MDYPALMIVGQNPPTDPVRCMHGAWLLHYMSVTKGPHEELVARLVTSLSLAPMDVYATQAVKCPTLNNSQPSREVGEHCRTKFLQRELQAVQPKVLLAFGVFAQDQVALCFDHAVCHPDERDRAIQQGQDRGTAYHTFKLVSTAPTCRYYQVRTYANVIEAPHPSVVGRFVTEESWLAGIQGARVFAETWRMPNVG